MDNFFSKKYFSRTSNSLWTGWYWTVDRWLLGGFLALMVIGGFLVAAASPAVAERIHLSSFYFVERHLIIGILAIFVMLFVSLLSPKQIRVLALSVFALSILLMIATIFVGYEIKGAKRWIHLPGFSLQPSEFVKPAFIVVAAWLFARGASPDGLRNWIACGFLYLITLGLLVIQPDLGMSFLLTCVWLMQFFLAGLPMLLVASCIVLGVCGLVGAYYTFDHVNSRVNRFLSPESGDTYQVEKSLAAFKHGGLLGTGPGQGKVKYRLPEAHADAIYAVAGEEFGTIAACAIAMLFLAMVIKGFVRVLNTKDLFIVLAVSGLLTQFGLQAFIHMASSLNLMPTKGMTLPFLSYGGSSMLGLALGMGMVLALTRKSRSQNWQWEE